MKSELSKLSRLELLQLLLEQSEENEHLKEKLSFLKDEMGKRDDFLKSSKSGGEISINATEELKSVLDEYKDRLGDINYISKRQAYMNAAIDEKLDSIIKIFTVIIPASFLSGFLMYLLGKKHPIMKIFKRKK